MIMRVGRIRFTSMQNDFMENENGTPWNLLRETLVMLKTRHAGGDEMFPFDLHRLISDGQTMNAFL